ncbi:hypothetical protein AGOR_G00240710 [Albula goreensis]|uniref:Uncharacterized protein n=1 Tax=Albula goreensis TaxID=1534307 RepID=A0A8T3CDC4_9TELE|nr:hypothetical protein AGOR_G00240710 [Albula goreensis]
MFSSLPFQRAKDLGHVPGAIPSEGSPATTESGQLTQTGTAGRQPAEGGESLPKILTVPIKRVTGMSRFLREKCLLSAQQVTDVLRDSPAIVLEDTSRLEYRFQYAYFRMGIQQEEMVKSGLFRVSTEEVRCRHSFLERRGLYQTPDKKGQTRIANPKLKDFLTIPEDSLLSQVALATQEEFEVFRKLMEREVQEEEGLESSDSEEEDEEDDESENRGKEGYKRRRK